MTVINEILLWLHFLGLAMGGGALLGATAIARLAPSATPEQRGAYMKLGGIMGMTGRGGLAVLIITGPLMLWLKWGGAVPNGTWFMVKMVMVLLVIVGVVMMGIAMKRVRAGNMSAMAMATQGRILASVALVLVVLAAVLAFT
jgi:putative membrane protein